MRLRYEVGSYLFAVSAVLGTLTLLPALSSASDGDFSDPGLWVTPLLFAPPFAVGLWMRIGAKRAHAAVKAAGYRACIACGQSMVGLGDSGPCPECGRFFLVEESRAYWDRVLDLRKR